MCKIWVTAVVLGIFVTLTSVLRTPSHHFELSTAVPDTLMNKPSFRVLNPSRCYDEKEIVNKCFWPTLFYSTLCHLQISQCKHLYQGDLFLNSLGNDSHPRLRATWRALKHATIELALCRYSWGSFFLVALKVLPRWRPLPSDWTEYSCQLPVGKCQWGLFYLSVCWHLFFHFPWL